MSHGDLLGTTWLHRPLDSGRFRCPRCDQERDCQRTELERQLVLAGRPVFRLGPIEGFRTCRTCRHAFPDGAAPSPGTGFPTLSEDERALLAVLAAVVFSDSAVRSAEKRGVARVVRLFIPHSEAFDVNELLRDARRRWGDPIDRLRRLRGLVDEDRRSRIVEAAYLVCTADGDLHPQESRLLERVGAALDLAPRTVRSALRDARHRGVTASDPD